MTRRTLSNVGTEPFFSTVIGLSSQWRDYRLVHQLNQNREIPFSFIRLDELKGPATDEEGSPVAFSLFMDRDEENQTTCYLVSNRSLQHVLVPGLKEMDFLLLIEGPFPPRRKDDLLRSLRSETGILLASEVNLTKIKSFPSFVNDLEFHLMTLNANP